MEGMVTRGDKKERSNMERGGKDSKVQSEVEGSLEPPLHRKVEEDGISKQVKEYVNGNDKVDDYDILHPPLRVTPTVHAPLQPRYLSACTMSRDK